MSNVVTLLNTCQRKQKGQTRIGNTETLATLYTRHKNISQKNEKKGSTDSKNKNKTKGERKTVPVSYKTSGRNRGNRGKPIVI